MHLTFDDVNSAFTGLVAGVHSGEIPTSVKQSRVGEVRQIDEPVIITYRNPRQRVLFNQSRDSNPFFNVYEFLHMISGRNDIAPLDYYSSNYSKQVQDGDSDVANGSYGFRWRQAKGGETEVVERSIHDELRIDKRTDQLDILINHLKEKPDSRRAVLQMWNVEDDLLKIDSSRDVCCNLSVLFSIRNETDYKKQREEHLEGKKFRHIEKPNLDMTVFNRSNDMIWGALGANYCHFSLLQEYVANSLGIEVGVYNQVTANAHIYTDRFKADEWLADPWSNKVPNEVMYVGWDEAISIPLVKNRETFDREVQRFVELNKNCEEVTTNTCWFEPFLHEVAQPMMHAFHMHKQRDYEAALDWASLIKAPDWQWVARKWIEKRQANWEKKENAKGS